MLGSVDVGTVLAAVIPVALAGLAMAWRLGGLERTVKDVAGDAQEAKTAAQAAQAGVAELRGLVDRRTNRGGW